MNITVLANRDLAANLALNLLLPELVRDHRLTIFLSSHVGTKKALPDKLLKLKFFEQTLFNELIFPLLGPGHTGFRSFRGLGDLLTAPVQDLNRINSTEGLETLRATEPDLILSIRYGGILKDRAIAVPELGVLNLHSGLLPDFRGVMATFWAMLHRAEHIGTTLHYISDAGIDTGDVIAVTKRRPNRSRSYLWNVLELYADGCRAMVDAVQQIAGSVKPGGRPQGTSGTYYTFPNEADLQAFHNAGLRLCDFDEMAEIAARWRHGTE